MVLKDGAILVADAHENFNRRGFWQFLTLIKTHKINTSQLILMGDIFDFLSFHCIFSTRFAKKYIDLINELSKIGIEVIYLEGNHDFVLEGLFCENVLIVPLKNQPFKMKTPYNKDIQLSHGDIFLPFFTKYFLLFLRCKFFLKFTNLLDRIFKFKISRSLFYALMKKRLYHKIYNFKSIINKKIHNYKSEIIIEGHYHQGEMLNFGNKIYFNLESFASEQSFFIVEYSHEKIKFARKSLKGH